MASRLIYLIWDGFPFDLFDLRWLPVWFISFTVTLTGQQHGKQICFSIDVKTEQNEQFWEDLSKGFFRSTKGGDASRNYKLNFPAKYQTGN